MAEFQEVMKQWRRRCEACEKNENVKCYINGYLCEAFCKMQKHIDPKSVEQEIMSWAAENPEPVYPTWAEYISEQIIHDMCKGEISGPETVLTYAMYKPIPADIAEKLGIEPKEE